VADSRDRRNYGCGRRLDHVTISRLAEKTAHLANRGSGLVLQTRSALARFSDYLKDAYKIQDLEKCTRDHVIGWVLDELRPAVIEGEISRATAAFYLSSINTVFRTNGRKDVWVSATKNGIGRGAKYNNVDLSNHLKDVKSYEQWLLSKASLAGGIRSLMYEALAHAQSLQWSAGLRFRESLIAKIGIKDLTGNLLEMVRGDGCKNNRPRLIHPIDGGQAVDSAKEFIWNHASVFQRGSLIPAVLSYKEFKAFGRNALAEFRNATGQQLNHHGNRHRFAHEVYARGWEKRFGVRIEVPVITNLYGRDHIRFIAERLHIDERTARELDNEIRYELSCELGHNRLDITYSYTGR
jgi:hypothetical protein